MTNLLPGKYVDSTAQQIPRGARDDASIFEVGPAPSFRYNFPLAGA
jgi:hypothetical protein